MALRQSFIRGLLQHMQHAEQRPSMLSINHCSVISLRSFSEQPEKPDEQKQSSSEYAAHTTASNIGFFTDGVKAVFGTAAEKVKEAVGLEKRMGKEGSQRGMEPAGVMENKDATGDRSAQYEELAGKHKQANDELLKGANVSDLYNKENTSATSAANTKPGGDPALGGKASSGSHDK